MYIRGMDIVSERNVQGMDIICESIMYRVADMIERDVTYEKPPPASACRNAVTYEKNPGFAGVDQPRGQASQGATLPLPNLCGSWVWVRPDA